MTPTTEAIAAPPKFSIEPEQQSIINELVKFQVDLKKSDGDFSRDHLTHSASRWNRIKSLEYFKGIKDAESVFAGLVIDLRKLKSELAMIRKLGTKVFYSFPSLNAVIVAVKACKYKTDANRLVIYKAETGGGKSMLCGHMAATEGAYIIEARACWRHSAYNALLDICTELGVDMEAVARPSQLEDRLLEFLNKHKCILCFDEGEFFGPDVLNLMKLILNRTPTVILITCIPEAYNRWQKFSHEARQVMRRTHAVIEQEEIKASDVSCFLANLDMASDAKECAIEIMKHANVFGRYDLIARIVADLATDKDIGLDDVRKAIARAKAMMGMAETEATPTTKRIARRGK